MIAFLTGVAPAITSAGTASGEVPPGGGTYVLGDSIAYGLSVDGLQAKLQTQLGGPARISFDGGRSITTPGNQIKKSALQSVIDDQAFITKASTIIIELGMNQQEASFASSQQQLMQQLKELAPQARYFWVDIGATIAAQAPGWSERNKIIYNNAASLGYRVISRYKSIFGAEADPFQIKPGQNFPGWNTEAGYGGPGNIHGFDAELSKAILDALKVAKTCDKKPALTTYLLGDSIAYGLSKDKLDGKLKSQLGGIAKISFDAGRSITSPGLQINKSAFESVEIDRDFIAQSDVIIIALGTNQIEASFADSQRLLLQKLKSIAPRAKYYWIDIGATIATQAAGWSARNKTIYDSAEQLGYSVISRYKAIFGNAVDPLHIVPGLNFPGETNEPGFNGPGNVHGQYASLSRAILAALPGAECVSAK